MAEKDKTKTDKTRKEQTHIVSSLFIAYLSFVSSKYKLFRVLVVFRCYLEIALRVYTYWAYLWSVLAYNNVTTVAALPNS